jgi:thiol-disulfide isomerase/thioredoxin
MADHEDNFDPLFYGIPHLEDSDFDNNGTLLPFKGKYCIVMIFATWCGPCKMFKPQHSKLHKKYNNSNDVVVSVINGSGKTTLSSEQDLMKRLRKIIQDFRGFPTIALFGPDGKLLGTHEGKRTEEDVEMTLKKHMK